MSGLISDGQQICDCTTKVLKKRLGSRHVISYKLALADRRTGKQSVVELIGKRYARSDGKATREFQTMRTLWNAGFGSDDRFRIPRPVEHFTDLKLILEERARGLKLCSYLGRNSQRSLAHARMAGLWLAKLHTLKVTTEGIYTYEEDLASLKRFVNELINARPFLAPKLRALEADIRQKFLSFQNVRMAMVHGDYHPENILVQRDNVTVIDFDRFCLADPAKDLGSFVAHMRTQACASGKSLDAVNHELTACLDGYFSAVPLAEGAALFGRIPPFVTHSCLEALYYVACVLQVKNPDLVANYLRCAENSEIPRLERTPLFEALSATREPGPRIEDVGHAFRSQEQRNA